MMKEILSTILSDHTIGQKANYLKSLFMPKGERLGYDPVTISIVGTTRCTLSCDMCPTHSGRVPDDYPHKQKSVKDIDLAMFKDIIGRFKNAMTVHIIGSGEPMLNRDFFDMVDFASRMKMTVKTFSNGTTIMDNMDRIVSSKLDGITISLNGHDAKEFRRMTGMDEKIYGEIYDATKKLIEKRDRAGSRVKVKLSFIIDRENYRSIPDMVDTGLGLGADHIFFCNFLSAPYAGLKAEERALMVGGGFEDELKKIFDKYPPAIRRKLTPPVLIDSSARRNDCMTHFLQARFDGDGNVSSCSMMLLDMSGNGSYKDAGLWNNEFFTEMRRKFLSGDGSRLPDPCRACPDNKGIK